MFLGWRSGPWLIDVLGLTVRASDCSFCAQRVYCSLCPGHSNLGVAPRSPEERGRTNEGGREGLLSRFTTFTDVPVGS